MARYAKWPLLTVLRAATNFPQKPYRRAALPQLNLPARKSLACRSARARGGGARVIATTGKFLLANFIEDDRMITALGELLINRNSLFIANR